MAVLNRGSIDAASTMCGILTDDGHDCPNAVPTFYEFNICAPHSRAIWAWLRDRELAEADPVVCPVCAGLTGYPDIGRTFRCKQCGHTW